MKIKSFNVKNEVFSLKKFKESTTGGYVSCSVFIQQLTVFARGEVYTKDSSKKNSAIRLIDIKAQKTCKILTQHKILLCTVLKI